MLRRRLVLALLLVASSRLALAENVVVWDFVTRAGAKTEIANNLTYEFEEALSQSGGYTVLERRKLDRLRAVIQNEKSLQDIRELSTNGLAELKKLGASLVIFGEVFDDVASGEVSITVTFQNFKGVKVLIKSILIKRGLVQDATSRRERMVALVDSIAGVTTPTTKSPSGKTARVLANDFIFDVQNCARSDRTVLCSLLITNNGEDRKLFIILNARSGGWADKKYIEPDTKTLLYDDFNNEATPVRVQLSNASMESSDRPVIGARLISGRPAEAALRFEGLSSRATVVTRLDITCVDGETNDVFVATFRNLQLKQ